MDGKTCMAACGATTVVAAISVGISSGFGALSGYLVKTPVGVDGGAVFGAFSALVGGPVGWVVDCITGARQENAPQIAKVISVAGGFFAGTACSWAITNNIVSSEDAFKYTDAMELGGAALGLGAAASCFIACCVGGVAACCGKSKICVDSNV